MREFITSIYLTNKFFLGHVEGKKNPFKVKFLAKDQLWLEIIRIY